MLINAMTVLLAYARAAATSTTIMGTLASRMSTLKGIVF